MLCTLYTVECSLYISNCMCNRVKITLCVLLKSNKNNSILFKGFGADTLYVVCFSNLIVNRCLMIIVSDTPMSGPLKWFCRV